MSAPRKESLVTPGLVPDVIIQLSLNARVTSVSSNLPMTSGNGDQSLKLTKSPFSVSKQPSLPEMNTPLQGESGIFYACPHSQGENLYIRSQPWQVLNHVALTAKFSSHHVHFTLRVTPPTIPCPTLSADAKAAQCAV